jgi:23S rRNA (uracil1939-C5)-methyltransferase
MAADAAPRVTRVQIVELAKGGDGVGRLPDGSRAVFVPGTAPGDVVDVELTQQAGTLRGTLRELVQASPVRVDPPCPFARACGGCDWMHVSGPAQREHRAQIVRAALAQVAPDVPPIRRHDAPVAERYRTRARLAVRGTGGIARAGYRAARSHEIVQVQSCRILDVRLEQARGQLREWLRGAHGMGDLSLYLGRGGLPALALDWDGELPASVFAQADARVQKGIWAGAQVALRGATAPAVIGDAAAECMGADGVTLRAPPDGFMQAFEAVNAMLVGRARELAACQGLPTLELFAGSGNLTVALARDTDQLETLESSAEAVQAARHNLERRGLRARVRHGDADTPAVRPGVAVVLLDPPRSGAAGAAKAIASSRVRRVVMISCDPATLARDVALLRGDGRFSLTSVDVFEMFPQTSHVETLVVMQRNGGGEA